MLQLFDESIKDSNLKKALKQNGYITASPIQQKILNLNEEDSKKDILIQAKAGLGKTLAFLLHLVLNSEFDESVIGLIIAPTREVAIQTSTIFNDIIKIYNPKINIQHFIGGNPIEQDIKNVEECNFVVGTPGRIKAIIQKKRQFFEKVQFFCLDEADKLMDKIFEMDLSFIKQSLPTQVKMVVTSATFEEEKLQLLETKYLKETIYLMADGEDVNLKGIQQHYVDLRDKLEERSIYEQLEYKMQHIGKILKSIKFYQAIIFLNKPAKCLELVNMLEEDNWPCTYICGKLTQSERKLAMDKTRNFNVRVLISSDLVIK
ncbi:P-loop containing nucleoside triphosphate hydrolase protein [Neoconidiobolus thromboides FSU 785]|nr:P-loop containing nucleoside triphosphate hydrolase protein [Neoconidiobolus thromboides FSU 785]